LDSENLPDIGSVMTFAKATGMAGITNVQQRPDLQWRAKNQFPFQVAIGSQAGVYAKCHGCKRYIVDRTELRIQTQVKYVPPHSGPYPGKANFCLNNSCVFEALSPNSKLHKHCCYPAFEGKIGISPQLKELFERTLQKHPNICNQLQWQFI
jgi:hypothetical protein